MAALEKMPKHPRLFRRNATYYHRAAIPKDIANTYPKREETFSLRTKDFEEARRLVRVAAVKVDQRFAEHRRLKQQPTQLELTVDQLKLIHDVYYQHLLEEDEDTRLSGYAGYTAAKSFEDAEALNTDLAGVTREHYARGELDEFYLSEAEDVLTWEGINIRLEPTSPSWPRLVRTLQEAALRAHEAIQKRFQGEIVETPKRGTNQTEAPSAGPLLSALYNERAKEAQKAGAWSPKLVDDYQMWTDLFIELRGDHPILEYKKTDARHFKNILMTLPSNRNKHSQTKDTAALDAVRIAKTHGLPTLSVSTINKALGRMQATWKWADKQLDESVADIFGPMKLTSTSSARSEADPFSISQLQAIFDSPLYMGCKSQRFRAVAGNTDMSSSSWYWLPLLGLFTGARLNELCQLNVSDLDLKSDIPFLRLHEGDESQRIKGHKKRNVPLHPELIRLGFTEYANVNRNTKSGRIFPELTIDGKGYFSDKPSKDFRAYIKKIGVKTSKTSFHSFRHNFKDACRHVGVNPDLNDILLGHSLSGMGGRYGDGKIPLKKLHEAICKIEYDGLKLQQIKGFKL